MYKYILDILRKEEMCIGMGDLIFISGYYPFHDEFA
jgi:hypothetical protein